MNIDSWAGEFFLTYLYVILNLVTILIDYVKFKSTQVVSVVGLRGGLYLSRGYCAPCNHEVRLWTFRSEGNSY